MSLHKSPQWQLLRFSVARNVPHIPVASAGSLSCDSDMFAASMLKLQGRGAALAIAESMQPYWDQSVLQRWALQECRL